MDPVESHLLNLTRRQFFGRSASGVGIAALGSLLIPGMFEQALGNDLAGAMLRAPHFAPKAKRVIFLHQCGGPSQLDLFDYKPTLRARFNEELPDSIRMGQRITTMTSGQARLPVAPSIFPFERHENNEDGLWVSDLYPHTGTVAKEMCVIRTMHTEAINHDPGITFFQTGHQQPGRPEHGRVDQLRPLAARTTTCPHSWCSSARDSATCRRCTRDCGGRASCRASTRACSSAPAPTPCSS